MILFNKFPGGKKKAVTMSYDDGNIADRRLIEIFNKYGVRGTFHINSSRSGDQVVPHEEFKELYKGHEVAIHGVTHASITYSAPSSRIYEVLNDRKALEDVMGYPVVGMSYANGLTSSEAVEAVRSCGIVYSRTTNSTNGYKIPENFLLWDPTCHHKNSPEAVERFLDITWDSFYLLYIWGHSYEFALDNNWDLIEGVCKKLAAAADTIWFATNIEIYDYITASRMVRVSVDEKIIYNPTDKEIWFTKDDETFKIGPGETLEF